MVARDCVPSVTVKSQENQPFGIAFNIGLISSQFGADCDADHLCRLNPISYALPQVSHLCHSVRKRLMATKYWMSSLGSSATNSLWLTPQSQETAISRQTFPSMTKPGTPPPASYSY